MRQSDPDSWKIPSLPFVWSALNSPENGNDLPDSLPFELGFDDNTGLIVQKHNDVVESALDLAYKQGSMLSGLMDEDGIGQKYAEDFLAFIFRFLTKSDLKGLRVLEIGCGNGYLLKCLQDCGAEVLGVEPGLHGQEGAEKWQVPIIQGSFPHKEIQGQFDLVISFAVLEHIGDPVAFLAQIKPSLTPKGAVIVSVPDVEPYIANGDISILLHEHWSYFDSVTLASTLRLAGYRDVSIEKSSYGGSIYSAMKVSTDIEKPDSLLISSSIKYARNYIAIAKQNEKKFLNFIEGINLNNKTLGIYVPFRAVNILKLSGLSVQHIRFFDDNPILLGTYYPGFDVPIESGAGLIESPTDYVLIMSIAFGEELAEKLNLELPESTVIRTISQVLA